MGSADVGSTSQRLRSSKRIDKNVDRSAPRNLTIDASSGEIMFRSCGPRRWVYVP
jgi:hypothetical protein